MTEGLGERLRSPACHQPACHQQHVEDDEDEDDDDDDNDDDDETMPRPRYVVGVVPFCLALFVSSALGWLLGARGCLS